MRPTVLGAALATLAAAGAATAATPLEDRLKPVVSQLAGRPAGVHCWSTDANWEAIKAQVGADANATAFVVRGGTMIDISPALCATLQAFVDRPPAARCRTGTKTVATSRSEWRWRTIRVRGKTRRVRYRVRVSRVELVPVFGVCSTPASQIDALWTVAHEAAHLGGVADEIVAECDGLQNLEEVAVALGAAPAAAELAARRAAATAPAQRPAYASPDCREDGALDRSPGDSRWP